MSEAERKILLERRKEIAAKNVIGGSELFKENGVNVQREILNFCICGDLIEETRIAICQRGGEKLCPGCLIKYDGKKICIDCFQKEFPLTKQQYKAQICLECGISHVGLIHRLTRIPKKEIKKILEDLRKYGYLEKRLLSYRITDKGLAVNAAYSVVWNADNDIVLLKSEVGGLLGLQ